MSRRPSRKADRRIRQIIAALNRRVITTGAGAARHGTARCGNYSVRRGERERERGRRDGREEVRERRDKTRCDNVQHRVPLLMLLHGGSGHQ